METYSQQVYPALISKKGIVFGKYIFTENTVNSRIDTIDIETARSLYAINTIYVNSKERNNLVNFGDSIHYIFTLQKDDKQKVFTEKTKLFTKPLINSLKNIDSGTRITIEGILVYFDDYSRHLTMMDFMVK